MTKKAHGSTSVLTALAGNTIVAIIKTIVAVTTGSASMFAESVHSIADTLNQSLLFIGLKRSQKPADHIRGYGYGIERFFWSLISACGILFIGAGVTIYHSIDSLMGHGDTSPFNYISIVVLVIAFVIEGFTLIVAIRELQGGRKLSKKIFDNADPVTLAVVYEDGAAVLGVLIALASQFMLYLTGNHVYDGIGGIIVGLILGILAVVLIMKNYQYIIGKPLEAGVQEEIIEFLQLDPCIENITDFKSVAVDTNKYRIYATVEWNGSPLYEEIYGSGDLKAEFENIKDDFREFTKLMFRTTDRIPRLVGNHIDEIEKSIREKFPEILYVDIEIN
ncbi:MAG: hypothetical protein RL687_384 [Candidatus Parcubacteria bacterium]|jgi:zinc transporter 9